ELGQYYSLPSSVRSKLVKPALPTAIKALFPKDVIDTPANYAAYAKYLTTPEGQAQFIRDYSLSEATTTDKIGNTVARIKQVAPSAVKKAATAGQWGDEEWLIWWNSQGNANLPGISNSAAVTQAGADILGSDTSTLDTGP